MRSYLVKNGINYPVRGGEKRAEPGEIVKDIPPKSARIFLLQGDIEEVREAE